MLIFVLFIASELVARPNCYMYKAAPKCYAACESATKAIRFPQGSFESQQLFDRSIEQCPDFAYSYQAKAVPYLKRGLFIEWKVLIDKAVDLAPKEYLGYRGWCRLQFLRDYGGAIQDIERLKSMVNYDIGACQTGDYHLNIALALCYKAQGKVDKARDLIIAHLESQDHTPGLYDYYHLAVLEHDGGNYERAVEHLKAQLEENDYMAETYYYLALCYKKLNECNKYSVALKQAEEDYKAGKVMMESYTEPFDKIYLSDILELKDIDCIVSDSLDE